MIPIGVLSLLKVAEMHEKSRNIRTAYATYKSAWGKKLAEASTFVANIASNQEMNYKTRAAAYLALGLKEEAIKNFQLAAENQGALEKVFCHAYIGCIREENGDYQQATAAYLIAHRHDQTKNIINQIITHWKDKLCNNSQMPPSQQATIQLYLATLYKETLQRQNAILLLNLISQNAESPELLAEAYYIRAQIKITTNTAEQITQAIADCTQAISLLPQNIYYEFRIAAYLKLAPHKKTQADKSALCHQAIADHNTLTCTDQTAKNKTLAYYLKQIEIYKKFSMYNEAIEICKEQIHHRFLQTKHDNNPEEINAYYTALKKIYNLAFPIDQAKEKISTDYKKIIDEHPKHILSYKLRMLYYVESAQYEKALDDINSIINIHIDNNRKEINYHIKLAEYYKDRIHIYFKLNELNKAATAYKHDCLYGVYEKDPTQFSSSKETIEQWFIMAIQQRADALAETTTPFVDPRTKTPGFSMKVSCREQFAEALTCYAEITAHSKKEPFLFNFPEKITPEILLTVIATLSSPQKINLLNQCLNPQTTFGCFIRSEKCEKKREQLITNIKKRLCREQNTAPLLNAAFPITETYKTPASALFFANKNDSPNKKITPELAVFHRVLLDLSAHKSTLELTEKDETIIEYLKHQTSWENIQQCPPASDHCSQWIKKLMRAAKTSQQECLDLFEEIHHLYGIELELIEEINAPGQSKRF